MIVDIEVDGVYIESIRTQHIPSVGSIIILGKDDDRYKVEVQAKEWLIDRPTMFFKELRCKLCCSVPAPIKEKIIEETPKTKFKSLSSKMLIICPQCQMSNEFAIKKCREPGCPMNLSP